MGRRASSRCKACSPAAPRSTASASAAPARSQSPHQRTRGAASGSSAARKPSPTSAGNAQPSPRPTSAGEAQPNPRPTSTGEAQSSPRPTSDGEARSSPRPCGHTPTFPAEYGEMLPSEKDSWTEWLKKIEATRQLDALTEFSAAENDEPGTYSDEPAQILPDLWLGSMGHARDLDWIRREGITAIVNAAGSMAPARDPAAGWDGYPEGVAYFELLADDDSDYPLLQRHCKETFDFLQQCRAKKQIALVHCVQGINRSATLVVAWLMLLDRMPLLTSVRHVCKLRQGVLSNEGFQLQLVELAHQNGLLVDDPVVIAEIEKEERRLKDIFYMFLPDSSGCLNESRFQNILRSCRQHPGHETMPQEVARSHWQHFTWFGGGEGADFDNFCTWLRCDRAANALFPSLLARQLESPPSAFAITSQIWLGGQQAACDADFFSGARITHALNVSHEVPNSFEIEHTANAPHVQYLRIPIDDQIGEDIANKADWLGQGVNWMMAALKNPEATMLVHCDDGVSRSCTYVIAFLMSTERITVLEASRRVRVSRPAIGPGAGFLQQLLQLEQSLGLESCAEPSI